LFAAKIKGKRKFVDLSFWMAFEKFRTESYINKKAAYPSSGYAAYI
jgi:hypothetical protein